MIPILSRVASGLRGWRALLATILVLGGLAAWDRHIQQAAPLYGVRPANATWVFSTGDFPTFWRNFEKGDVFARVQDDWSRPQGSFELAVRLATGIRPTPTRWRIWMGKRLTVGQSPDGIGFSVYPGLLLRIVSRGMQMSGHGPDASGIARMGDIYYSWRSGFLILSRDRPYVEACMMNTDATPLRSGNDAQIAFQWTGPNEGYIRTLPGTGFPVEGRCRIALSDGDKPLSLTNAWPSPPVFAVAARTPRDLETLATVADRTLRLTAPWKEIVSTARELVKTWDLRAPPKDWDRGVEQVALAVLDVDTTEFVPVPDTAFIMRQNVPTNGEHPLRPVFGGDLTIDYEWQGQPGTSVPWLGEKLSPCLCGYGPDWILTTNEPLMASLAGALRPGPTEAPDVDVTARVAWDTTAGIAKAVMRQLASRDLLPEYSLQDADSDLSPKLDALGKLGSLRLDGRVLEDGWIAFNGRLFDSEPSDEE